MTLTLFQGHKGTGKFFKRSLSASPLLCGCYLRLQDHVQYFRKFGVSVRDTSNALRSLLIFNVGSFLTETFFKVSLGTLHDQLD